MFKLDLLGQFLADEIEILQRVNLIEFADFLRIDIAQSHFSKPVEA